MTWSLIICVLVCVCGVVWSEKYRYFGGWGIDNNDNNNWLSPRYRSSNWLLFSDGSGRVRAHESLKPIDWYLFCTFCTVYHDEESYWHLKEFLASYRCWHEAWVFLSRGASAQSTQSPRRMHRENAARRREEGSRVTVFTFSLSNTGAIRSYIYLWHKQLR